MRAGFTLVELLIIIAIIALLVSLLLPSLDTAKELAREAVCMANLHGIGHAELAYAHAHDRRLPPSATGDPRPAGVECAVDVHPWEMTRGVLWYETLVWGQYLADYEIFTCPTDRNRAIHPELAKVSYGVNAYLGPHKGKLDLQIARIYRAAETFMTCPNNGNKPTHTGVWNYAHPDAHRHRDYAAMYIFCDGHTERKTFRELFDIEYDPELPYWVHWEAARPGYADETNNGAWSDDYSGEIFPYWVPWERDGEFDKHGNKP